MLQDMEDALKIVIEQCEMWVDSKEFHEATGKRMDAYYSAVKKDGE